MGPSPCGVDPVRSSFQSNMQKSTPEEQVREEFNCWAEAGCGEEMEESHLPIVLPTLALIEFQPIDTVLDLGCGSGWLARRVAGLVPEGRVLGVDVSDVMVRRAQQASSGFSNVTFLEGTAHRIPWQDGYFNKVISVESAYYWPEPSKGLSEILRVLAKGGSAWILINYYRDNPHCHQWGAQYNIPAHLLAADEWADLFRQAGFTRVGHRRIPDNSRTPEVYTGRWFRDAEQMRRFKQEGALLIHGAKTERRSPPALPVGSSNPQP
jgi:ubiquinone/menaquinone biosynthesis C-methylase UbiE